MLNRDRQYWLILVTLVVLSTVGAIGGKYVTKSIFEDRALEIDPQELFVAGWATQSLRHSLTMRNPTSQPIDVAAIKTSCNCTSIHPPKFRVAPNSSQELRLEFNVSGAFDTGETQFGKRLGISLVAVNLRSPNPMHWQLTLDLENPFIASPRFVDFGQLIETEVGDTQFFVALNYHPRIKSISYSSDDPRLLVAPSNDSIRHGCRLGIKIIDSQPADFNTAIQTTCVDSTGQEFLGPRIRVNGAIISNMEATRSSLTFSKNDTDEKTILVMARDKSRFSIVSIDHSDDLIDVRYRVAETREVHKLIVKSKKWRPDAESSMNSTHIDVYTSNRQQPIRIPVLIQGN